MRKQRIKTYCQKVVKNKFDVVVLDINMPGTNIIDVLKQLKKQLTDISVLVLSMHPEEQYAFRVLKAGASGYLNKESAPDELVKAIRKVSRGGKYVSSSFAEKMAEALDTDHEKPLHATLSDREYQVLCMIASGQSVKKAAEALS